MTDAIELEPFTGLAALRALRPAWEEAFAAAEVDRLGNAPEWGLAYAEAFVPDADVFGWVARAAGRVVAFLPFRREPPRGRFALRRALLLADGTFDSDYLDLPCAPGFHAPVLERALDALAARRELDAVVLAGVPDDSATLPAMRALLTGRRLPRRERPAPGSLVALPPRFDTYLAALAKRVREKVRKSLRDADARGATWGWCEDAERLERDMDALYALHRARWQAEGQPGSFDDPRRRAFYGSLARAWLADGRLRLARLELEGAPIACQLGVLVDGVYCQIQEGYDPAHADWRCATALRARAIEALIAEGVRAYDFLGGRSRHKDEWGACERPCTTIAFALPRWRARLAYGARAALDRRGKGG